MENESTSKKPGWLASLKREWQGINGLVFLPPFLLLLSAVIYSLVAPERFGETTQWLNAQLVNRFGWAFSLCALSCFVTCVLVFFSDLSDVRLGGSQAEPLMSRWNWFSITICTTIAVGILFWATAEPLKHFNAPPVSSGLEPRSPDAAQFAMTAMFLHWTLTPYAIYAVASLTFAFVYYNMKLPFSLGSPLSPILGRWVEGRVGNLIDAICLYSLVAGMAASLGTGILTLSGGLTHIFGLPSNVFVWACIALAIVCTFIASSVSGLMNGIRILSDINTKALMGLAVVVFILGPTFFIMEFGLESFGNYLSNFFKLNTLTGAVHEDDWPKSWTLFYWAVWLAWTPITACFLGRIAYGRTVREFLLVNFVLPALFGACWMAIFSGTTLHLEMNGAELTKVLDENGAQSVSYSVFESLPWIATPVIVFYVLSSFICFVTSADSNTSAMASISSTGITPDNPEGNMGVKILWGVTVGMVAWVMISFGDKEGGDGTQGIKIISNLGGFPAVVFQFLVIGSLFKLMWQHKTLSQVDNVETG